MKQFAKNYVEFHDCAATAAEVMMYADNSIIYGMSSEIFIAQSDVKGGTWNGAVDGLKKNRPIYVRYPEKNERPVMERATKTIKIRIYLKLDINNTTSLLQTVQLQA